MTARSVSHVYGRRDIGLILDEFRFFEIHRTISFIVSTLESFKQRLQELTGFRKSLQQFGSSRTQQLDGVCLFPCRLSKGWYMLEARPDNCSLGRTITVRCYSDKNATICSGKQMVHLGNTRLAKRIIHVDASSCCVRLNFDTQISVDAMPALTFVRLSKHVARNRIQRALKNACVNIVSRV